MLVKRHWMTDFIPLEKKAKEELHTASPNKIYTHW